MKFIQEPSCFYLFCRFINELIESIMLAYNEWSKDAANDQPPNVVEVHDCDHTASGENNSNNQGTGVPPPPPPLNENWELESGASGSSLSTVHDEQMHPRTAEWAKAYDAATQRRTEVLMPENLENMWTIGRNYKKDFQKKAVTDIHAPEGILQETRSTDLTFDVLSGSQDPNSNVLPKEVSAINDVENKASLVTHEDRDKLKRSNSTSKLEVQLKVEEPKFTRNSSASLTTESYSADANKPDVDSLKSNSDMVSQTELLHATKLRCRVRPSISFFWLVKFYWI